MLNYLLRRAIFTLIVLLAVSLVMFVSLRSLPGGPAAAMMGDRATGEQIKEMERQLGLDQPIPIQYGIYLVRVLEGDLGTSIRSGAPVVEEIRNRFPNSLQLAFLSVVLSSLLGIALGVFAALRHGTIYDYATMVVAVLGRAVPEFWFALVLILVFAVGLGWFPAGGYGSPLHLVLPVITLAASGTALTARLTRSSMLDVISSDYVRTARAKGLAERIVTLRHMLRNALIPVVTVIGLVFGFSLGGSVLVETVFAWPGMGRLIVESIFNRDYPVVQGAILVYAFTFCVVNLLVDVLYGFLDPRIQFS